MKGKDASGRENRKSNGRSRKTEKRHNAEVQQRKSEQLRQARELEEQQAAEIARQFQDLKAATNEELDTRCTGLEKQLSEVCKEKEKLQEKVEVFIERSSSLLARAQTYSTLTW